MSGQSGERASKSLPQTARAVIVGGGIAGCSVAYHLTKLGWKEVVLLEQGGLAGGTTWHAAGMVGRLRTSSAMARINDASAKLYAGLEAETGLPTGWKQVGSLLVARTEERMVQFRRTAAMSEYFGIDVRLISVEEAVAKWPIMRPDDLIGAVWLPDDGKVQPQLTAVALGKGAEQRSATVLENVRVVSLLHRDGRVNGVRTTDGDVVADIVVLCGGMWTRQLALTCGVSVPLYPVEHHYALSNPIPGVTDDFPCTRDPDGEIYFRTEGAQVLLGAFQKHTKAWMVDRIPDDFSFKLLDADWEKFAIPLREGLHRLPVLETAGFERFVNGPESFTPDSNFLIGETPELAGLFVAAGFNSAGIATAGGAGEVLARWIIDGEQPMDLWSADIRRFAPAHNNRAFLRDRVTEALGTHYRVAWPNFEFETGRNLRISPLHDRLAARGACFGAKMGMERPIWFAHSEGVARPESSKGVVETPRASKTQGVPPDQTPVMEYAWGRQNWFDRHAAEHRTAREAVAVFDQSSFSKFLLRGRDALQVLQRLCGNDMDVPDGKVVYTGLFNDRGTFESDLTAIRLATDTYYIVSGAGQPIRDFDWIRRHVRDDEHAELVDVTSVKGVIGVMGPHARELLRRVTDADLSNAAFPFGTAQRIAVGQATVLALRITYVGELGWELHVPTDQTAMAYDAIMAAGLDLGVSNAGHYAINSLRLEKGYRAWGPDLSCDDTPLEAGLGFAVKLDKPAPFLGREAILRQKAAGVRKRLISFVVQDPKAVLWGGERIYRDAECVGYTTSASYGHTVGGAVALGYVRRTEPVTVEWIRAGHYSVDVAGTRYPATATLVPPYDPTGARIRV